MDITQFLIVAQDSSAGGQGNPIFGTIVPILLFLVIMYLILIRPQQKRNKEHQQLMSRLKAGDKVVTNAGIHGTIKEVDQDTVELNIAENVTITLSKNAVLRVLEEQDQQKESI